ncbi:MAG: zinc-finger domain-containing protein, partial [Nitrospinae bacterium]|nr:zinc-finger domain-containing protein [Nitrospinota bacterium]
NVHSGFPFRFHFYRSGGPRLSHQFLCLDRCTVGKTVRQRSHFL